MTNTDISNCIFCKIIKGESPSYKIWEDQNHIAILNLHPNTEGFTVVIAKEHLPSYAFENTDENLSAITCAAKKVGLLIDSKFSDVARTGMIFEGYGVDHLHAKLVPMHGTKVDSSASDEWRNHVIHNPKFFEHYEGYISSHDSRKADDEWLQEVYKKLTS